MERTVLIGCAGGYVSYRISLDTERNCWMVERNEENADGGETGWIVLTPTFATPRDAFDWVATHALGW